MKNYKLSFTGRKQGAIGIFYPIKVTYKANDIHEAISLLYDEYEHIQKLEVKENGKGINIPEKINFI